MLRLREIKTEEILTPRSVVHMLNEDTTVSEALDDPLTIRFSRIPIYAQSSDHVTGNVFQRSLFKAERAGNGSDPVKNYAKKISRVSEKLPVQKLLDMYLKMNEHLFLVEDEFGQTSGVVTLEDAIETLLGREIMDESDLVEDMQELAKGKYRARLRKNKQNNPAAEEQ